MKNLSLRIAPTTIFMTACGLIFFIAVSMLATGNTFAAQQYEKWQKQRLMQPTKPQLENERRGHIFIYDGMSEQDVDRAMDQAFGRIDSMMFINIKTKEDGGNVPSTNNDTSDTDDDGC